MGVLKPELLEEKPVYLYELSDSRFKEIKATLKIYDGKKFRAYAVPDKDPEALYTVSVEEFKVYGNYLWSEKRYKEKAAEIFTNHLNAQLRKQKSAVLLTESKLGLINKYYNEKRNK